MARKYYVYILASKRNGTLYIGVTNDIARREWEHKIKSQKSFASRYNIMLLVYYEERDDILTAISREKAMKKWDRSWKMELIEKSKPEWLDLLRSGL